MPKIRDLIREAHDAAESHPLNQCFINGTISDTAYNLYVFQRSYIIGFLDNFLPEKFARQKEFIKDLPDNTEGFPITQSTQDYLNHLEELDDRYMIGHIYVNYMGDLYGGQIIRNNNPDRRTNHLNFDGIQNEFIHHIRNRMHERDEELAEQANNAFRFIHDILDDVEFLVTDES